MADERPPGLFASVQRLLHNSAELVEVRLELFATELQQEKLRLLESLAWLGVALLGAGVGLTLGALFLVVLIGEEHRLAALGVIALLCLGGAWIAWRMSRAPREDGGAAFEASLIELRRDRAALAALAGRDPARSD